MADYYDAEMRIHTDVPLRALPPATLEALRTIGVVLQEEDGTITVPGDHEHHHVDGLLFLVIREASYGIDCLTVEHPAALEALTDAGLAWEITDAGFWADHGRRVGWRPGMTQPQETLRAGDIDVVDTVTLQRLRDAHRTDPAALAAALDRLLEPFAHPHPPAAG